MKRFLVLFLIVALVVPASSFSAELDFYAAYAHSEMVESENDAPFFSFIQFAENGKCYYSEQRFYPDRPGSSCAFIGSWSFNDDGEIVVELGRTLMSFTIHILDSGDLINTNTKQIYNRVNSIWVSR